MKPAPECRLCCQTPCDPEIDAAVRRVHRWLRHKLRVALEPQRAGKVSRSVDFPHPRPKGEW